MREAVDWVVAALSGTAAPDDVAARLAARLVARGDIAAVLAGNRRFAAFREHPAAVENVEPRRPWSVRAVVRTGPQLWELDVTVEAESPHRISSFQPRLVAADAVEWAQIAAALRESDHWQSALGDRLTERVCERLIGAVDEQRIVGLAAGVAVDGEVVFRGYFGTSDFASGAPLSAQSVFRVGSVTKVVTALAVLRLVETGAVDLQAPVSQYLGAPELISPNEATATVGDLLLHRAGLPKDLAVRPDLLRTRAPLAEAVPHIRLAWPPGERCEYSNIGYGLLAGVIESAAGMTFARFCADEIVARYGLTNTAVQEPGMLAPADVRGYRVAAGRVAPAVTAVAPLPSAGGMTASSEDLLALAGRLSRADDSLIRAALAYTAPAGPGVHFGAGLAILQTGEGQVAWRGGATDGFTAEMLAALDGSCDIVLLASKSPPDGLRDVATRLMRDLREP